jgi:spore coat polysaccharide biosynthesis predicted glycosyltransferase SpsG
VNQLRVIILADGNNKIGMGHVYRSFNLAKKLRKNGFNVVFLTQTIQSKKIFSQIFDCKFSQKLNNDITKNFLKNFCPDIIILDKLKETKKNLSFLHEFCPIMGIDYIGKHKTLIDFGINILYPKSGISKNSYSSLDFSILDEKFQRCKKKKITKEINSIIILQGGADTYCFTPKIIKAVSSLNGNFKISVVLGPSFKCWTKLNQVLKESTKSVTIYRNVKNMSSLMQKADLAVTAGGNTLLELACLGIPSLVVCGEKFEEETAILLEKKDFCINTGFGGQLTSSKIHYYLTKIITDYALRKKMHKIGPKLVDGKGSLRIAKILQTKIHT